MCNEERDIDRFLAENACPKCGSGKLVRSGFVLFSDPMKWGFRCSCRYSGYVCYTSLKYERIEFSSWGGDPDGMEELVV